MTKAEYRIKYTKKRELLNAEECAVMSEKIVSHIMQMPILEYQNFMLYMPIKAKKEVDITLFTQWLLAQSKNVYLPKIQGDDMVAVSYNNTTEMKENDWGILEPTNQNRIEANEIDVFIIPMLICDIEGNRIGYGKGFYDKFLSNAKANALKIGVNYFPPETEIFSTEKTDIPLDYCVLPDEIVSFVDKLSR